MHKTRFLAVFAALAPYYAPAIAQVILPPPPEKPQVDGNGVDVQSLTPSYGRSVLSIGPKGPGGLDYTIMYTGTAARDSLYTMIVGNDNSGISTATVQIGSYAGSYTNGYPSKGDGSSVSGAAYYGYDHLQKDGTDTAFTQLFIVGPDGAFGTNGWWFADSITHPNGIQTSFHYRSVNIGPGHQAVRIQSVTTNMGYQFKYNYASNTYDGTPGYFTLTSIVAINNTVEYCDPNADTCSLTGSWPHLQYLTGTLDGGVTDANGGTTYITSSLVGATGHVTIQTPDKTSPNYDYTMPFRPSAPLSDQYAVSSVTVNGKTTSYAITNSGLPAGQQLVTSSAPLSQQYSYTAISNVPGITKEVDPLGRTTTFTYDAFNRLLSVTPPEGNSTNYTYDTNGNILTATLHPKTGSGSTPLSESWTYSISTCSSSPNTCNQPVTHTDPRGKVTSFTYDSTSGQVLTETDPADANGINPVKRYAYTQRYAYIKDATGAYVPESTGIWLLTSEKTCQTTATVSGACAGGSSDEIETDYDYGPNSGPNNLLLRGKVVTSNGTSLRTCYGYDNFGNKISETMPRAGLTSCP